MIHSKKIKSDVTVLDILYNIKDKSLPFLLDSAKGSYNQGNKSYIGFDPEIVLKSKDNNVEISGLVNKKVNDNPLNQLKILMDDFFEEDDNQFIGGAVGLLSYDFTSSNCNVVLNSEKNTEVYDAYFGIYFKIIEFDNNTQEYTIYYLDDTDIRDVEAAFVKPDYVDKEYKTSELIKTITKEEYSKSFDDIKTMIENGDVYEVNLTQQFIVDTTKDKFDIYKKLREVNKADFMAYMDFGEYCVLSSSPERFFDCQNGFVQARPIKGTIRRSDDKDEDEKLKKELLNSDKDISELLMIVDLMRNDLGMSCDAETIKAISNYSLETYENVHHLVATIVGILREDEDVFSLIKNIFPGGSITGAPKLASIKAIDMVEKFNRNIYTGSIGYISFNQNCDFNILIRTILKIKDRCYFSGGGAITWDSEMNSEYDETIQKSKKVYEALI
ncbi:anthranilate synthase component I family protein [Finegoldia dalianensis]|uniref:Anthranilate synthase component I family protein n=1 Tax=Finegoldia dalianensis TaxID=3145239 RepID=A0ABW9KB24_9FIRM